MIITEDYTRLMVHYGLPERFRASNFKLFDFEEDILREFIDNFYEATEKNGYVDLKDFTEFMDLLCILKDADTDQIQLLLVYTFMKSAKLRNSLESE